MPVVWLQSVGKAEFGENELWMRSTEAKAEEAGTSVAVLATTTCASQAREHRYKHSFSLKNS